MTYKESERLFAKDNLEQFTKDLTDFYKRQLRATQNESNSFFFGKSRAIKKIQKFLKTTI
jgi:hypothetical protein